MLTKIFHPNVSLTGEICVNTLKKDWKPEHTLSHVLQVIRCLLIVPFPESSLNDEAGKLFMESFEEFSRKAKLMTSIHATTAGGGSSGAGVKGSGGGGAASSVGTTLTPTTGPSEVESASVALSTTPEASAPIAATAPAALGTGKSNVDISAGAKEAGENEKKRAGNEEKPTKSSKSLKRL